MVDAPVFTDFPTVLHKKITNLGFGSSSEVRPLEEEYDISHLAAFGFFCYSGITKCENTANKAKGVNPDLNIMCSLAVKKLKEWNQAFIANKMEGPTMSS